MTMAAGVSAVPADRTPEAVSGEPTILRALARFPADPPSVTPAEARGLDWTGLLAAAERHALVPLLARAAAGWGGLVPPDAAVAIATRARAIADRNLALTGRLMEILATFAEAGIPAVPWKGPLLALSAYGDLGLRQFGDLDIIVPRGRIAESVGLLLERGYERFHPLPDWQESAYLERIGEVQLQAPGRRAFVEIHWTVVPTYYSRGFDAESIWERLRVTSLGGVPVNDLALDDLLLALAIHGTKHRWGRLAWIADVAALIAAEPFLDWDRVVVRARREGINRILAIALRLAETIGGATIPPEVAANMARDATAGRLAEWIDARLMEGGRGRDDRLFEGLERFDLQVRERARDRVALVWAALSTPTRGDWDALPGARRLPIAYRAIRPLRLTRKYVPRLLALPGRVRAVR
ncbi:MAG TPA: nucleotidyltransferase family protein [Candidatus Limnocylindrales bacterium]|nr:nucleotidyltransferase family protein [Candidatus Limnocylindrales bacterium]